MMANQPGNRTSKSGNRLILIISLLIAGVFLFLALQGLDWSTFIQTLRNGNYAYLPFILILSSITYAIRSLRWKIFLSGEENLSFSDVFWANMIGYMGNAYLPVRAGEVLRSVFIGKKSGLGTSFVLATALAERILDTVALVLIGTTALLWHGNITPLLADAVRVMALFGVAGLIVILAAPFQEKLIIRIINGLPLPEKITLPISRQAAQFLVGIRSLQNWRRLVSFVLLTACIWLIDAFANTIGVQIISQSMGMGQALILLSALGLSSAIPSVPGNIGVYQLVAIAVLTPFGFSRAEALAYILISQILNYIVITFWGLLGLWRINRNKEFLFNA